MDARPDDDIDLMSRLKEGDDLALNELMTRWQQPLANYIFRYVGDQSEAVDLAQETFVRVYESRRRYEARGKFSTWLFAIATNLCRNHTRWKTRHPTISMHQLDEQSERSIEDHLADPADSPEREIQKKELALGVRDAVQALPHDLRVATILFEYDDLSYSEIAQIQGCTEKAVETRLYRARDILRQTLARFL